MRIVPCLVLAFLVASPLWADEDPGTEPTPDAPAQDAEVPEVLPTPDKMVEPLLWMVEGTPRVFLLGTIHVPDKRVVDWPPVTQVAFEQSDAVRTELAMGPGYQMRVAVQVQKKARLPAGQTLSGILGAERHARLKKALGIPLLMHQLESQAPWMATFTLMSIPAMKRFQGKAPLDQVIYDRAREAQKDVGGLEVMDEQLDPFATLSTAEQIEVLDGVMDAQEKAAGSEVDPLEVLLGIYLRGDADAMLEMMRSEYDPEDPLGRKLWKGLIDDRNRRMAERILKHMQDHPGKTLFVAVGAGHMPGPTGVVALLRKAGHRVTRLTMKDVDKARPPKAAPVTPRVSEEEPAPAPVPKEREPAGAGAGG